MAKTPKKSETLILKRYTRLGVRIKTLGLSVLPMQRFLNITKLSKEELEEIHNTWKDRYSYSIYIYGFSIVVFGALCFDYLKSLSLSRVLLLLGFIATCLSSGVSVFLNSNNVQKLDNEVIRLIRLTKNSIKYFLVKFFVISDKSTKRIHTDYVVGPNMFLPIGVLLCFALLSNLGFLKDSGDTLRNILDQLLISYDIESGWYIWNYAFYLLLALFTLAPTGLDHEKSLIKSKNYKKFIVRSSIVNVIMLFIYLFALSYMIYTKTSSDTDNDYIEVLRPYWALYILGGQNFLVPLFHSIMTIRDLEQKSTKVLYFLLLPLLLPFLLVFVIGLQLIPAIIVIPVLLLLIQIYKLTKTILEVPSFVRVLGFLIAAVIFLYKFYTIE